MERRRRRQPTLALALMASLVSSGWSAAGAVNVGDTAAHCTNVTTVEVYESNSASTAAAEITTASCDQVVVKVQTMDDGVEVLDLRRRGIRVVESLPAADTVCVSTSNAGCSWSSNSPRNVGSTLDNNLVQSFATGNSVSSL